VPETLALLLSFVTGAAVATVVYWIVWGGPLFRVARACRSRAATDLSRTLPEEGPSSLRSIARTFNDVEADFQEVLLLFAHMVRSARASADLLRPLASDVTGSSEAERVREVLADIDEMQATIKDFRYFRVSLDDGVIRDAGVSGSRPPRLS
jgi:methyl-accepting chemotaxis protein